MKVMVPTWPCLNILDRIKFVVKAVPCVVMLQISVVVLVLRNGTDVNVLEQVILGVGIPYSILWNILGAVMVRTLQYMLS